MRNPLRRFFIAPALVAVAAATALLAVRPAPGAAATITITGTIVNSTTGAKDVDADVVVVAPAKGMAPVATTRSQNGSFAFPPLETDVPVYLVRVTYDGVPYSESVQPADAGPTAEVMILVYESTTASDAIRLSTYHLAALRHDNMLTIEKLFGVNNTGSPARTVTGEGTFRFFVPENAEIREVYVMGQGMPIKRTPVATDEPGVWRLDYPLRPGITQVDVTFDAPYDSASYTMTGKALYDVDEFSVFQADPAMTVSSTTVALSEAGDAHGMKQYTAKALKAGTDLAVTFAGGEEETSMPAGHGEIKAVHNEMQNASVIVIVLVLLAMMVFMALSLHGNPNPLDQPQNLRAYYDGLLRRLARLDDLNEAQAVDRDAYRTRRDEIKRQLAAIVYRLRKAENASAGNGRKNTPGREQGKERARAG